MTTYKIFAGVNGSGRISIYKFQLNVIIKQLIKWLNISKLLNYNL